MNLRADSESGDEGSVALPDGCALQPLIDKLQSGPRGFTDTEATDSVISSFFPGIRPERASYLVNISARNRYLYLETPKVCCSSIKRTLHRLELAGTSPPPDNVHDRTSSPLSSPYDSLSGFLTAQFDPRYVRFSFVRNPFGRILSCYLDKMVQSEFERVRLLPELGLPPGCMPTLKEFLLAVKSQQTRDMDIHWLPQATILEGLREPYLIGRYETFSADFAAVLHIVSEGDNITCEHYAPHASGADAHVGEMIGAHERDLIVEIYHADFARFGYSLDPAVGVNAASVR